MGDAITDRDDLAGLIDRARNLRIAIYVWKFLIKGLNMLFAQLGTLAVLVIGGWMVIGGSLALGSVVAFVNGFERLMDPSRELIGYYRRTSQIAVQYGLIRDKIDASSTR
jgi:putative ABC transport system ATP-binding protein